MDRPVIVASPHSPGSAQRLGNLRLIITGLVALCMGLAVFSGVFLYDTMQKKLLGWSIAGYCLLIASAAGIFLVWGSRELKARTRLENALEAQRRDLEEAQRIAHVGSWSYDPRTDFTAWSAEMFRIFGLDPGAPAPTHEQKRPLIHPDDWQRFDDAVRSAATGGQGYTLELRIVRPDGSPCHIVTHCETTRGKDGAANILHGTAQDITERIAREAEQARLISELREAVSRIKTLSGLLPICSYCKKIRDDEGYWQQVEVYVRQRTTAEFTHGICPNCTRKYFPDVAQKAE